MLMARKESRDAMESMEIQETKDHKETKDLLVPRVRMGQLVLLDLREIPERLDQRVPRETAVPPVQTELREMKVLRARRESRVLREYLVLMVRW